MTDDLLRPLLAWPLMLLAAWLAGEWLYGRWRLPRTCAYALLGIFLGGIGLTQGVAPRDTQGLLAVVALALALFELGYRINPGWFRHNPGLLVAGIVQALLTFGAVVWVAMRFGVPADQRLVIGALCVSSSPAAVIRITHELRSAGQVTERLLHLCALNCLIAVLLLKLVVGYWHLETSGDFGKAAFDSVYVIVLSLVVGGVFGVIAPWLNRLATSSQATTVTFALAVLFLTAVAQSLHLSSLLAALAFGAVTRSRRILLSHAQRNFGGLGDVLTVFLFVYVGSLLSWRGLGVGLVLGGALLVARSAVHVLVNLGAARLTHTTLRKGALTGVALMPLTVFALLLLEESRVFGFELARESMPALSGLLVLLAVLGPLATQLALRWAREAQPGEER